MSADRSSGHRPSHAIRPAKITQRELARYHDKKARQRRLARAVDRLRESLLERQQAGARVVPGAYSLRVRVVESRCPTWAEIDRILGERIVSRLRRKVAVRKVRHLIVSCDEGSAPARGDQDRRSGAVLRASRNGRSRESVDEEG